MEIRTFADFWPYYVRAHSKARTRLLHAIGSVLALVILCFALALNRWLFIAVPVVGYAFAWYAHFFVEHNKPATFRYPLWSLISDFRMFSLWVCGRLEGELRRAGLSQAH